MTQELTGYLLSAPGRDQCAHGRRQVLPDGTRISTERQRLATARKLLRIASDKAATPAERQTAYKRARRELDGLIALPEATIAALEERIAGMLDAPKAPDFHQS